MVLYGDSRLVLNNNILWPTTVWETLPYSILNHVNSASEIILWLPAFIKRFQTKDHGVSARATRKEKRKQGKRGGVRLHLKKQWLNRIPLLSVIKANVHSLRNKVDELQGNIHYQNNFSDNGIMAFTEEAGHIIAAH